jgi:hypothetical protein
MARHWPAAIGEIAASMNDLPKVVFSRTLERVEWKNTRLVKGDPVSCVSELKRQYRKYRDGAVTIAFRGRPDTR